MSHCESHRGNGGGRNVQEVAMQSPKDRKQEDGEQETEVGRCGGGACSGPSADPGHPRMARAVRGLPASAYGPEQAKWETSAKPATAVTETVILISARLESVLSRNKEQIDVNR